MPFFSMKGLLVVLLAACVFPGCAGSSKPIPTAKMEEDAPESDFPFLSGKYILVGLKNHPAEAYAGRVEIEEDGATGKFKVARTVAGKKTVGDGWLERSEFSRERDVFCVKFLEDGAELKGRFLWAFDFDNEVRISGYIWNLADKEGPARLETLFPVKWWDKEEGK